MLHELDRELKRKGQRFIRYADDFSIYAETKTAAQHIGNDIYLFLKNKLKLPINREPKRSELMSTFKKQTIANKKADFVHRQTLRSWDLALCLPTVKATAANTN